LYPRDLVKEYVGPLQMGMVHILRDTRNEWLESEERECVRGIARCIGAESGTITNTSVDGFMEDSSSKVESFPSSILLSPAN
jgi:hypothetical protein